MPKPLNDLRPGENGIVLEIRGGQDLIDRLNSLGIIPGKKITKVSSMSLRGPITIKINRTKVAIGFGMATKIIVDVDRMEM